MTVVTTWFIFQTWHPTDKIQGCGVVVGEDGGGCGRGARILQCEDYTQFVRTTLLLYVYEITVASSVVNLITVFPLHIVINMYGSIVVHLSIGIYNSNH